MVSRAGLTVRFAEDPMPERWVATPAGSAVWTFETDNGEVIAMDVARDDQELARRHRERLRQAHPDRPLSGKTSRGTMGVMTIKLTESKGALAGAMVVREHQELVFISQDGMVQRTSVRGISRTAGRPRASA